MVINDFLPFCETDISTNLLTQSEWASDPQRSIGNQPGVARSKLVNKAQRQANFIAANFAQFVSDTLNEDVLDNADDAGFLAQIKAAILQQTIQTKTGNYTLTNADSTILVDASGGSFTITLPAAATTTNKVFTLIRTDSVIANQVIISGTIAGQSDWKMYTVGEILGFQSNGSVYSVVARNTSTPWINDGATLVTSSGVNPTKPSGIITDRSWYKRDGSDFLFRQEYQQSNTTGAVNGTGDYKFSSSVLSVLPIDTTQVQAFNTIMGNTCIGPLGVVGNGVWANSTVISGTTWFGQVSVFDSTHLRLVGPFISSGGVNTTGAVNGGMAGGAFTASTSVGFSFNCRVPILGMKP